MKAVLNVLFVLLILCYPFAIFFGLKHFEPRVVSLLLAVLIATRFLLLPDKSRQVSNMTAKMALLIGFVILIGVQVFNRDIFIKLYPFFMNMLMLVSFGYTLFRGPPMIERFARMMRKDLPDEAIPYLRKVTIVWCVFFVANACVTLYTSFFSSIEVWTFYNGFLAYIIMGVIFVGELLVRQIAMKAK